jgi:hypothetical protein
MDDTSLVNLNKLIFEIQDRYPKISDDNAFVAWFLHAFITNKEEDAVEALKGGARDKGLDGLYIDHGASAVFVVQGKYHHGSTAPNEKRSDVIALADLGRTLVLDDPKQFKEMSKSAESTVRTALTEARKMIHERSYRLRLCFVTTGKVSQDNIDDAESKVDDWESVSFDVYARTELINLMQDYVEGAAPPTPTLVLPIDGNESFKRFDQKTGITSWIFTMRGPDVGELFNENGVRIFARNIRGYLGSTNINKGIEHTLTSESEFFWYFNNGVTVICDEAKQTSRKGDDVIRVKNAQIINGQQTTRSLAHITASDARVLVKLIEVPRSSEDGHSKYNRIVRQIVAATNWQNAISQSDLRANDTEQVRIERELRKYDYQYLRKRMKKSEAREKSGGKYVWMIQKEELAQAVAACLLDPAEIRRGKNHLFEDAIYNTIFKERHVTEYLSMHWLNQFVRQGSKGDTPRGYARWLVLNFLWSRLNSTFKSKDTRDRFRYVVERKATYQHELGPLTIAIDLVYQSAMDFFKNNSKSSAVVLDESSFFKLRNRHRDFSKHWEANSDTRLRRFDSQMKLFLKHLQSVEM